MRQVAVEEILDLAGRHADCGEALWPQQDILVLQYGRYRHQRREGTLGHGTKKQSRRASRTLQTASENIGVKHPLHIMDDM